MIRNFGMKMLTITNLSTEFFTLSLHDALPIFAIDSTVDIFTFYVPHRHVYGEQWIKFMKDGVNALFTINVTMREDRKSGSAGMPRPISYAVFCLKKKNNADENYETEPDA